MKCEYCSAEPVRACLRCGCLFCKAHGEVRETSRKSGQPMLNSQCQKCAEATRGQFANVGKVFFGIGAILTLLGAIVATTSKVPVAGLIFLCQGIVFAVLGLVFRASLGKKGTRPR